MVGTLYVKKELVEEALRKGELKRLVEDASRALMQVNGFFETPSRGYVGLGRVELDTLKELARQLDLPVVLTVSMYVVCHPTEDEEEWEDRAKVDADTWDKIAKAYLEGNTDILEDLVAQGKVSDTVVPYEGYIEVFTVSTTFMYQVGLIDVSAWSEEIKAKTPKEAKEALKSLLKRLEGVKTEVEYEVRVSYEP